MPRTQLVRQVRDLLREQDRITIFLACYHIVSVTRAEIENMPPRVAVGLFSLTEHLCPYCPDLPPQIPEKSTRELWRDAGEP